jgi:hypothetical protein
MSYFDAESIIPHCVMQSSIGPSNHAMKACGAFSASYTSPIISFCIFDSNSAGEAAGALGINGISHNYISRGQLYNNSFRTKSQYPSPARLVQGELTREGSAIHLESFIFSKNFVGHELLAPIATWGRVKVLLPGTLCFDVSESIMIDDINALFILVWSDKSAAFKNSNCLVAPNPPTFPGTPSLSFPQGQILSKTNLSHKPNFSLNLKYW